MALVPAALQVLMSPAIFAALQAKFPEVTAFPEQLLQQTNLADAIATGVANALIPYMISSTIVTTSVNGVTGTGPMGGPLPIVSQPGIGTIS